MGRKTKSKSYDGPMSYRDLQIANNEKFENTDVPLTGRSYVTPKAMIYEGPEKSPLMIQSGGTDYYGKSTYDKETPTEEFLYGSPTSIQDNRAETQPWYAKIGAGLAKGAILAGTTFLDGTVGLLFGGAQAIGEGRWSALWDNDFSKAMQYVNEASEELIPNYYTTQEQESPWYENIFTANFLGDKFLKNLGFAVGAYYSGALLTKPIKLVGALAKASTLAKEGEGILTAAQAANRVKNITNATSMVSSGIGSITSAVNEGRIEALNNSTDWYNAQKELIDQAHEAGELDDKQYAEALLQANDDRLKMGNADLLMNLPILTASNLMQFGKLYAGGMQTAKKGLNIVGNAGEWASGSSRLGNAWAITRGALSEGTEELTQGMASRIAGDYYATDVNNFIKAKTDPTASQETLSWVKSFAKGINDTINDGSAWEEFFIGSLTGALGMPRFRGFKNEEGNWQSPVTIEGGAFNTWREFSEKRGEETQVAEYMNQRFNSPEFKNYYQGLVRHNKYQNDMNQAVENDDPFAYHNAEHGQMISDVMMFDKAGKLEDLVDMINNAFDTSDENLESIVKNTTSTAEDGKSVGPFVDENGNPAYSTERGKQEMVEQLTKSKDSILKTVDDYRASREVIMQSIPAGTHLTDDQLDELTWMHSQINNWSDRAVSMSGEIKSSLGKIIGDIDGEIAAWSIIRTNEGTKSADLTDAYKEADKKIQELQQAKRTLEHVRGLDDEVLASSLSNTSNTDFVNTIQDSILMLPESTMNMDKKEDVLKKLDDVKKLANGKETFRNKLSEYLTDPSKQAADHQRAEQDNINEEQTRIRSSLVDSLNAATDVSSFRNAMESSDLSQEDKQAVLQQMKDSGDPLANDYSNIEDYKREVRRALAQSNISDQVMQDAYKLLQDQYAASSNLEEMSNSNSVHINNDTAFDETSDTAELSAQRFQAAQYALQTAMAKVNNDQKFKDRFADSQPEPTDQTDDSDPTKGTDKDTTGDSGTSTVPPVNGGASITTYTPPVGDITSDMVSEENKQTNTETSDMDEFSGRKGEKKKYYRPAIPQLHIVGSKEGDFRPFNEVVKEREKGVNFDTIYDYLVEKGAFDYINSGKLHVEDEIGFMIDPEFEEKVKDAPWHTKPTIFMVTKDGQIVGSLDDGSSVENFEGLAGLEERVRIEYASSDKAAKFISPTQKTKVSKIMVGKFPYGTEEKSLADIPNVRGKDGNEAPIFGIVKNGTIATNGALSDNKVVKPIDIGQKEGRMYLLIPNGAGKYSPVAVRVKHFNNEEFRLDDATVAATPIAKDIKAGIQQMAEVTNDLDLKEAVKALNKDLYLGNLHIDWFTSNAGSGIRFTQVERDANGNEVYYTDTQGQRKRKENVKTVFMTEKWDSNTVYEFGADNNIKTAPDNKDAATLVKEITDVLTSFNLPIQVSIDRLNTKGYANRLINSGILTSNLMDARVLGTWFTTDYFDRDGKLQSAISPASLAPQRGRKVETPVGGKNSTTPGIPVTIGGRTMNVDLQNMIIYEEGKNPRGISTSDKLWVDLAWAQNLHGDRTEGHNMHNNCVITPSGDVLNRTTKQYLQGDEAQKVKDIINNRNNTQRQKQEKANRVIKRVYDAQKRVDKSRTDSENYYVLEEDGEYHAYSRVHTRLGSNWTQTQKQADALKYAQINLSKFVDDPKQYDGFLTWLEKKYEIDLSNFRGKTDIKSREMVLNTIRDKMSGTNSTRALQAGSAVDTVIRQFFTTSDTSAITRPSNMSETAFSDLIGRLEEVKSNMEGQGMRFLTDNIVLFQKYPDGTRVAGEVDILAIDADGNFKIYDVKTSRYSFGNFTDRRGHTVNYFESKSPSQRMSNKDYYTLQLSAYKNLFESQFGEPITQIGIMPFVLSYDGNTVSNINGEPGIFLQYNPAVNVPLVGSAQPQAQPQSQSQSQPQAPIIEANKNSFKEAVRAFDSSNNKVDRRSIALSNLKPNEKTDEQVLLNAGYVKIGNFFVSPNFDKNILSIIPTELLNILYNSGIRVLSFADGNHSAMAGSIKVNGHSIGVIQFTKNNSQDRIAHNILHEIGHYIYNHYLSNDEKNIADTYTTPISFYIQNLINGTLSSAASVNEENFVEGFATYFHNKIFGTRSLNRNIESNLISLYRKLYNQFGDKAQPVATPTQPQTQSSVPIFNANAETHNPVNMVIPEAAFDTQVTKTGYYIMDNKVHRGYLVSIGEINGVEVHVSKVPNITKGFKRPNETEHVASVNYIAVFPNGATVTIMQNVTVDTEQQAIDKIKAALNGNPQRVTAESSKETVLSKAQQPAQVSGAAATAQREQAIRGGISSKRRRPKLRKAKEESATVWDRDKEIAEITKMLPQLSAENRIRFVKGLIRVADRGALAWGQMEDGIITLSDIAAPGTAYHEAFHVVFNHLLEDNERAALLQEARSRFGKGLSEEELEEELAEEFRMFQMGEITDNRSIGRKILDFFKNLIAKTTNWKNFKPSSMAYYQAIRRGKYANKTLRDVTVSRLNREQYTQEMKYILANAPRDSQGRLLAPNGKSTNLNERQWLQVRTKAFKEWFGDWEKIAELKSLDSDFSIIENNEETPDEVAKGYDIIYNGKKIGKVALKEAPNGNLTIRGIGIDENIRGKGIGKNLYKWLIYKAYKNGGTLYSDNVYDSTISPSAHRVWKSLIKEGFAEEDDYSGGYHSVLNASKVVDENGEPMVVYHGTPSSEPIDIFYTRQELGLPRGGRGSGSEGYYFTPNREYAERFTARDLMFSENTGTGHIEEVFLNVRNIALFNSANFPNARVDIFYNMDASGKASFESLGYDGIELGRILNNSNGKRPEIVVFNKNQIKSATSNNGAYSRTNNDIRYRRLGEVRISTLDMVPQEERQILEKKGWTTEHFNRISQRERDKALECLGL